MRVSLPPRFSVDVYVKSLARLVSNNLPFSRFHLIHETWYNVQRKVSTCPPFSLRSLVNLVQERSEHLPRQDRYISFLPLRLRLRNALDQIDNLAIHALLIGLVLLIQPDGRKHLLHLTLAFLRLATITLVERVPLFGRRDREHGIDAPRTFVIDDVRPDFPDLFGRAGIIEPVVLDLEVFAEREEDRFRELERSDRLVRVRRGGVGARDVGHVHRERDG